MANKMQEAELGPTISLAKGMDDVKLCEEVCCEVDEPFPGPSQTVRKTVQAIEQVSQLLIDIRRQAEEIASLSRLYCPRLSCPVIDVLEQMPMDCPIVSNIEGALGQRLSCPKGRHFELESLERLRVL